MKPDGTNQKFNSAGSNVVAPGLAFGGKCRDLPSAIRSRPNQAGFTLIEMIVVIVILSLVAGLVLVKQPLRSAGLDIDATARALANTLSLARSQAIAQGRTVPVVTTNDGFSIDGGPSRIVPRGEALTPAQVVFTPDGGSTGATIFLVAGHRRVAVIVNWLTGRVSTRKLNIN